MDKLFKVDPKSRFIRYPGGKQRLLSYIMPHLPNPEDIKGFFIEPFVGGGSVFFALAPQKALLSDINPVLIDLYKGLKKYPLKVWELFQGFPITKEGYYLVRDCQKKDNLAYRAARTLYLNRTCFKGMWRENSNGQFNVGYGGQDRRWVVNKETLLSVSEFLKRAKLISSDFEEVIEICNKKDFIFLDPPYKPGEKELRHSHYVYSKFNYDSHKRLARCLNKATKRGIRWAMTTSGHIDITSLFYGCKIISFAKGTGHKPGIISENPGEVLICNY